MPVQEPSIPAVTAEQMRQVDQLLVETFGISLLQVMEHAGWNLAGLTRKLLGGSVAQRSVVVAAGKGNNGGGGLVAARHLANWGAQVAVLAEAEEAAEVPRQQWQILAKLPVERRTGDAAVQFLSDHSAALVVDAVIGYGLTGPPRGWAGAIIDRINAQSAPVLALDVPSGLDATTGEAYEPCVRATATMALALPKTGLVLPHAKPFVGALYLADIGVPPSLYRRLGLDVGPIFEHGSVLSLDT